MTAHPREHSHSHGNPIDVHAHWYPKAWLDLVAKHGPAHGIEWKEIEGKGPQFKIGHLSTGPAGPRYVDLDARLQAMDEQGVAIHAMSLSQPMAYWADGELGERLSIVYNDELAKAHTAHPGRLIGLATLPMQAPDLAVREVGRASKLPGVRGFYMATRVNDKELSDPSFFPVYEAIEALGLPILLHPVFVIGHERLEKHYLTNLLGNPFESAIAAAHLIFGGVLDRFPRLDIVLPHAGGAFPWLIGRLNRGWQKRADLQHIKQSPLEYLRRFHYDTIGYSDPVVDFLIKHVGADRVLMGSDYCFPVAYEQPVEVVVNNPLIAAGDRHAILEGNARRLLKNLMPEPKTADRIVLGNVVTLDKRSSRAEALAIVDGRVLMAGTREDVMLTRTRATKVDDFTGATIIPGFNDAHAHLMTVGLKTLRPTLAGARSVRDVLDRVSQLARGTPKGEWIVTMPVGEPPYYFDAPSGLAEQRMPDRRELDAAAPEHPVYLSSPGGYWGQTPCHSSLNSLGLKLNNIDRNTKPTSPSIEILRDAQGEPTGVIVERSFASIVEQDILRAVPRFGCEDRVEALRRAIRLGHEKGITSIYEGHGCAPDVIAAFRHLHEAGELTMRSGLVLGPTWLNAEEAERTMRDSLAFARAKGLGDAMLKISGVFLPCFGEPHLNAIVARDINDLGWGDYVRLVNSSGDFERQARLAAKYNLRVHTVISNRLEETLPVLERLASEFPIGERRWVLEHISKSTAQGIEKIRAMGVGVTLIPGIYLWKGANAFSALSDAEVEFVSPAKQLLGLGVPVSAGTDAVPYDPLHCVWAMVTRRARSGRSMGAGAVLTNEEALRLVTVNGAWLTFEEDVKGPLSPGYFADLAVLAKDPLSAAGDAILDNECIGTMVGGRWVHGPHAGRQGES